MTHQESLRECLTIGRQIKSKSHEGGGAVMPPLAFAEKDGSFLCLVISPTDDPQQSMMACHVLATVLEADALVVVHDAYARVVDAPTEADARRALEQSRLHRLAEQVRQGQRGDIRDALMGLRVTRTGEVAMSTLFYTTFDSDSPVYWDEGPARVEDGQAIGGLAEGLKACWEEPQMMGLFRAGLGKIMSGLEGQRRTTLLTRAVFLYLSQFGFLVRAHMKGFDGAEDGICQLTPRT